MTKENPDGEAFFDNQRWYKIHTSCLFHNKNASKDIKTTVMKTFLTRNPMYIVRLVWARTCWQMNLQLRPASTVCGLTVC